MDRPSAWVSWVTWVSNTPSGKKGAPRRQAGQTPDPVSSTVRTEQTHETHQTHGIGSTVGGSPRDFFSDGRKQTHETHVTHGGQSRDGEARTSEVLAAAASNLDSFAALVLATFPGSTLVSDDRPPHAGVPILALEGEGRCWACQGTARWRLGEGSPWVCPTCHPPNGHPDGLEWMGGLDRRGEQGASHA